MNIKSILDERFEYDYATSNRYKMPKKSIKIGNQEQIIELLVTNGYLKLFSNKGRGYWIAQVSYSDHKSPDWKFHFNIAPEDLQKGWDAVVSTIIPLKQKYAIKFPKKDFLFGIKVISTKHGNTWPDDMKGREITVYIYEFDEILNGEDGKGIVYDKDSYIIYSREDEEPNSFWYELVFEVEKKLLKQNVKTSVLNNCADGDLWIGKYCSLRNEAFTLYKGEYVYPPNETGWNAANQKCPFSFIDINLMRLQCYSLRRKILFPILIGIFILFISIIFILVLK